MKLEHTHKLAHPLEHPTDWTDPATGVSVPKTFEANLRYRRSVARSAEQDPELQRGLLTMSRDSFLFWANTFAWTYHQIKIVDGKQAAALGKGAKAPLITWPVQDAAALQIIDCIREGRDICVDKSRDMGASWIVLLVFLWLWLFYPDTALMVASRIEATVDKADDPDSLMWKLRFALKLLPWWMRPPSESSHMHLANQANGSVIDGSATSEHVGRGGRRAAVLIDEAAAIPHLEAIMLSASPEMTPCRIVVSTPGVNMAYTELRFSGIDVVVLGYWDHPDKGRGRKLKFVEYFGREVWWSPWLEHQVSVRKRSLKDLAQNALVDHEQAGTVVFDLGVINHQLATYAARPLRVGDLTFGGKHATGPERDVALASADIEKFIFKPSDRGALSLWCELVKERRTGQLRPRVDRHYALGIDISQGQGASNSVISVGEAETKRKVAEWASATVSPTELARVAAALGFWFGGAVGFAFMSWEANGPGGAFTRAIKELGYPWLDRQTLDSHTSGKATKRLGWTSTTANKIDLLNALRGDMAAGDFINPSEAALKEAAKYVFYETGGVGPRHLEQESADASATHGDRVIADMLLARALKRMPRVRPTKAKAPTGSEAWHQARDEGELEVDIEVSEA